MLLSLGNLGMGRPIAIGGDATPSYPFQTDSNTYWWDFTNAQNTIDALGDDTLSYIPERVNGAINLIQPTKDYQPLDITNGADFGNASNRTLSAESVENVATNATGFYLACNVRWTTSDGGVIFFNGSPDIQVYLTGSRKWGVKIGGSWKMYSTSRTLDTWYTLEMFIDTENDQITLWIDGVETSPQFINAASLSTFGTVTEIKDIGSTAKSLDGSLQHLILRYGDLITDEARQSISDYLIGVRP